MSTNSEIIDRRAFLKTGGIAAAGLTLAGSILSSPEPEQARPNIVLILVDDVGYGDVGYHGWDDVTTPNIDALASEGTQFSDAYVTAPMCSPSRAGLLTGRYQQRWGSDWNYNTTVPEEQPTMANHLKEAEYATACYGKWHWRDGHPGEIAGPSAKGFDEFEGFVWAQENDWMLSDGYYTDVYTDKGISFMERNVEEASPFFLYLSYGACHVPLHIAPGWEDRFLDETDEKRRQFLTMLGALDASIGRVVSTVDRLGIAESTLIVFLSDNGGYRTNASSNEPLRGCKMTLYEGGIREPMIWRWKNRIPSGRTYERPVSALDISASVLTAAGLTVPDNADGVDLLPFLLTEAQSSPHEHLFWMCFENRRKAVRRGTWKWVVSGPDATDELFDLSVDIGEQNNLAADYPDILEELKDAYAVWESGNAAPVPGNPSQLTRYLRNDENDAWERPVSAVPVTAGHLANVRRGANQRCYNAHGRRMRGRSGDVGTDGKPAGIELSGGARRITGMGK